MKNPFKYGTVVDNEYFTDRVQELQEIVRRLNSDNHLVLISPRRFGKTSLTLKAVKQLNRPYLMLNLQNITSTEDFAAKMLKEIFRQYPWEKVKHLMSHFRVIPTVSANPMTDAMDVTFQPVVNTNVLLEDAMALLEKVTAPDRRLIVIFDEFQEVMQIGKGLDKQLRSIMQLQQNLNYIFLGSQESMMEEIFERKKSPFYHFGRLMRLSKIPHDDFLAYIMQRLSPVLLNDSQQIAEHILDVTANHPYYTQQLASQVWELAYYEDQRDSVVEHALDKLVCEHDLDYERLWINFNRMDRRIMQMLCSHQNPLQDRQLAPSTAFSAIKRLTKAGYVIRTDKYEIEDPFFRKWMEIRVLGS